MSSTPETRMIREIFASIDQGLTEGGMPLTDDQRAFLYGAVDKQEASIR